MINIRRATEEDRKVLFLLVMEMHGETDFRHYDFEPEIAFTGLGAWLRPGDERVMFVADVDGQVVGMLAATRVETWFGTDTVANEDLFFVHVLNRGGRAAFALMRAFHDWAKQIGANHIRAGVATGNCPAAERLYAHFGLRPVGGNFSKHL